MARILSIEDDAEIQHMLGYVLQKHGYEIHYAFNGKEGYEKVMALHPDLVILDLMLPVLSGVEVLKLLRAQKELKEIPVIVMTAFVDEVNILEESIRALGAVEYLRKPLEMQELLNRIRSILANSSPRPGKAAAPPSELRKGAVKADPRYRTVWVNDRLLGTLPRKRFALFQELIEAPGAVTREDLLKRVWSGKGNKNALEKAIQRLREALGPSAGRRLQTRDEGYELLG